MVVEEIVHQDLAIFQDLHACVHGLVQEELGFVHVDACQVVSKDIIPGERGAGHQPADLVSLNLHIDTVFQVFHRFAAHRVVHQPVEVGLEVAFCLLPKLGVHPNVLLHPGLLVELDRPMHLCQAQPQSEICLQVSVVDHVIFFALLSQHQLLTFRRLQMKICQEPLLVPLYLLRFYHLFHWCEQVAVERLVQLFGVLEVYLQNPPLLRVFFHFHALLFCGYDSLPLEVAFWQWQAHRPAVQVVRVQVR